MFVLSMGAAVEALMVRLAADGWGSAWVSSTLFCPDVVRDVLNVAPSWEPMGAIAVGRPAQGPADRTRRDPHGFLHVH
jgi:coenzyme F420-0:L-glutamate ligase/coenzyme F420-1:gamma-L-glutamate ligase